MNLSKNYALKAAHIIMITSLLVGISYLVFLMNLKNEKPQVEEPRDDKKTYMEMNLERVTDIGEKFTDSPAAGISGSTVVQEEDKESPSEAVAPKEVTPNGFSSKETEEIANKQKDTVQTFVLEDYPKMEVVATGYYAGVESTGKTPDHPEYGITYSGVKVRRALYSTIAADPRVFPLGTILYIPGYGFGVVADTGSAIKGKKIDLYFETLEDVYNEWGKKLVEVYIIQKGKGKVTEEMLDKLNSNKVYVMNQSS